MALPWSSRRTAASVRLIRAGETERVPATGAVASVQEAEVRLPRWVGTRTPDQVAAAVVQGVERGRAELDVAPLGLRLGTRLAELAPVTAARVQRRLGSARIADALADAQREKR